MVVFTCNHCGESLQKPKVEKHYATACRTAKFLTCVDCFKDFRLEEYAAHTKCVTEEERYAAKGAHPQGVVKKGEVKQQSWTDMIQSIVDNAHNATVNQQRVLEVMAKGTNVPRKKNKFSNFIRSSLGNRINTSDIEYVWNLIENVTASNTPAQDTSNETEKKLQNENSSVEQELPKKKKKKSKQDKENGVESTINGSVVEQELEVENNGQQEVPKKKKKKSKENNLETTSNGMEKLDTNNEDANENVTENGNAKKNKKSKQSGEDLNPETQVNGSGTETSKKKKRKSENKDEEQTKKLKNGNDSSISNPAEETSKSKKRKSKTANVDEATENGTLQEKKRRESENLVTEETSKSKKRKSKTANVDEATENGTLQEKKRRESENLVTEETVNNSLDDSQASNFSFAENILEILKGKNNISLKKLEKKVLNAYYKQTGTEHSEKAVKKFNKKLKKVNGIEIAENNVRLIGN